MSLPTLTTRRLVLRPFILEDAATVQRLAGAYEIAATTLNIPHPYEDGMAEAWIVSHGPAWEAQSDLTLAVTLGTEAQDLQPVIGAVGLGLSLRHRRAELGYWLGLPYWNQGYTTEAAGALVNFGFETLALNRIEAGHYPGNLASGRVMQKLGMQQEGILRQHTRRFGKFEDRVVHGLLASDRLRAVDADTRRQ